MKSMCGYEMTSESNTRPTTRQESCEGEYCRHAQAQHVDNKTMEAREGSLPSLQQHLRTPAAGPHPHRLIKGRREPFPW